jgi:L-ascorbate metabolism protein UlaG (beta-lactamase superfamily)
VVAHPRSVDRSTDLLMRVACITRVHTIIRNHDPAVAAGGYDWDDRVNIGEGIAVTLVATRHWSARNLSDRNMALWASFVIEAPGGRIYFVADAGYGSGSHFRKARERHGPFKLAILPIGAYEPLVHVRPAHESG